DERMIYVKFASRREVTMNDDPLQSVRCRHLRQTRDLNVPEAVIGEGWLKSLAGDIAPQEVRIYCFAIVLAKLIDLARTMDLLGKSKVNARAFASLDMQSAPASKILTKVEHVDAAQRLGDDPGL